MIRIFTSAPVAFAILGLTLGAGFASTFAETAAEPNSQTTPVTGGAANQTAKGQAHAQHQKNHGERKKAAQNSGQAAHGDQASPTQQETAGSPTTAR